MSKKHRSARRGRRLASTWPPVGAGTWTPDMVARLLINPVYALQLAPTLAAPREASMTRGQWVAASATAIEALGPQTYLEHLVAVLTEEGTTGVGGILSPAAAITVAPVLCEPHPPLIDRTEWVAANIRLMDELGPRRYLALLLDVLAGNYV